MKVLFYSCVDVPDKTRATRVVSCVRPWPLPGSLQQLNQQIQFQVVSPVQSGVGVRSLDFEFGVGLDLDWTSA